MSSPRVFLDSNVLVYLFDSAEPDKQEQAMALFGQVAEEGLIVLSTQVLQEFFVVSTRKLATPLDPEKAIRALEGFASLPVFVVTPEIVLAAARTHRPDSLSFWDALIVQTALAAGAEILYTEDLQHGRRFGSLKIENPFADR